MAIEKQTKYWGKITLDEMHHLNNLSEEIGWKNAVSQVLDKDTQEVLLNEQRADWKYLTGVNSESKVLDVGCGLGAIAFSLAKASKIVYTLEPVWERTRFVNIRIQQENIQNIKPICANALHMPFPDSFFDLVVLNGVLEWVEYLTDDIKPNRAQEQVLKEISRVIKPNGTVYIGIENRFAFFYFLGTKDPHTGLPFINLMPRYMANLYHRAVKNRRYSTYLYSYSGYKNLLYKSGFKKMIFYTPLPSYRNFSYIFPLDNIVTAIKFWLYNLFYSDILQSSREMKIFLLLLKFIINTPLSYFFKLFAFDYSIIASKGKLPSSMFQYIASTYIGKDEAVEQKGGFRPFYYKSWSKKMLFYFQDRDVRPSYVWKVADCCNAPH